MILKAHTKLKSLTKHRDCGLLILRLGIGGMFAFAHGWGKISGGPEKWAQIGGAMGNLGINFAPTFWGFMAALSEFGGGLLLAAGFLFRPACMMMLFTMIVAATMHLSKGDGIPGASHAIEAGILFLALIFIGPGKYSVDKE